MSVPSVPGSEPDIPEMLALPSSCSPGESEGKPLWTALRICLFGSLGVEGEHRYSPSEVVAATVACGIGQPDSGRILCIFC